MQSETFRYLNLFGDVFERVRSDYVEEVDDKEVIEAAINGMLTSLDPHSGYMNEESFEDMQVSTRGEFGGLGIEVTMENGLVKVVSPIDDTPAFDAGIQPGDFISAIDDEPVMGMTLPDAVDKMRGAVGSKVKLSVLRDGLTKPLELTLVRDVIKIRSVRHRAEKDVGYIRITSFNENTYPGLEKAIEELKKEVGEDKIKGYVLDLRNNPGGLLDQAISVSDAFLEKGEVVSTRGRIEESVKRFNSSSGDLVGGKPVVVIINSGSASASEIVSGALQDHKRAIVIGTRSFGKGSVQTVVPLPGYGAMKLTTSRYYTPSGRSIQAKGIDPDIVVEQAKVETISDTQRHEADLKGRLENTDDEGNPIISGENPTKDSSRVIDEEAGETGDDAKDGGDSSSKPADDSAKDYQLSRALDLIRGLAVYNNNNQNQ
jgi:carboxyl-terminal processing protease